MGYFMGFIFIIFGLVMNTSLNLTDGTEH